MGSCYNYFQREPQAWITRNAKVGKVRRIYGAAQTPLARVLASAEVSEATKATAC